MWGEPRLASLGGEVPRCCLTQLLCIYRGTKTSKLSRSVLINTRKTKRSREKTRKKKIYQKFTEQNLQQMECHVIWLLQDLITTETTVLRTAASPRLRGGGERGVEDSLSTQGEDMSNLELNIAFRVYNIVCISDCLFLCNSIPW